MATVKVHQVDGRSARNRTIAGEREPNFVFYYRDAHCWVACKTEELAVELLNIPHAVRATATGTDYPVIGVLGTRTKLLDKLAAMFDQVEYLDLRFSQEHRQPGYKTWPQPS